MRTPSSMLAGAACVLALAVTGCSDNQPDPGADDSSTASTPTESPTSSSPTPATPEDLASDALERYFAITQKAEKSGRISDLSELTAVAAGTAYFDERKRVRDFRANGVRLRGAVHHNLGDVVTSNDGAIVVADCEDRSDSRLIVIASGNEVPFTDPQGNPMPDSVRVDYSLTERAKGEWVVETVDVRWRERC